MRLTKQVADSCMNYDLPEYMVIGTSAIVNTEIDGAVGMNSGIFNNPFLIWGRYQSHFGRNMLKISFQFHHTQMDGAHAGKFLELLQKNIDNIGKSKERWNNKLNVYNYGELNIDETSRKVSLEDKTVNLTRTEFAILKLLIQNPGQVIAKSVLLDRISLDTPDCTENSLKTHISHLRGKLREISGKEYVESVWGIGFRWKLGFVEEKYYINTDVIGEKDGFVIRLAQADDAVNYYEQNYCPLDKEVARLTGCKEEFSKEEVVSFFLKSLEENDRYFFLIIAPDGDIIGESVINEIDWDLRCANFRIGLYRQAERGKGIGTWATEITRDFAFEKLKLHRLELDVYSFNPRAETVYLKAGFKREGVLRDAIMDGANYADDILMSILEDEWRTLKTQR